MKVKDFTKRLTLYGNKCTIIAVTSSGKQIPIIEHTEEYNRICLLPDHAIYEYLVESILCETNRITLFLKPERKQRKSEN